MDPSRIEPVDELSMTPEVVVDGDVDYECLVLYELCKALGRRRIS